MQATIDETNYRREKQEQHNIENGIVPTQLSKKITTSLIGRTQDFPDEKYTQKAILQKVAEERASYNSEDLEKAIAQKQKEMEAAAKNLDFIKAAQLRDEIVALKG